MKKTKENNYCSFIGEECNKISSREKEMKVFFSYPSNERIKGYMNELFKKKQLEGLEIFPWEKLTQNAGIIFCKICQEVLSSRAFVADITYLNQNVLFELGFAIAQGKLPILIKEKERTGKILGILKDIMRIDYTNINMLANKLADDIFQDFPFTELTESQKNRPPTLFFINAEATMPVKRYIYKRLEEFSKRYSYKINIDDSSEIPYHKLITSMKKIKNSRLVVCHMVGTDYKNYDEINAQVSFFAGFALGNNIRTLILQEKPSDRMIDLQQIRKEYTNKDEAIKILDKWLLPEINQREKNLKNAKEKEEYISLHEHLLASLGHPAAEYDVDLEDNFIETSEYLEAKRFRKNLFLGRRGSGKTANFFQLSREFSNRTRNLVVKIQPSKLQLISAIDKLHSKIGENKTSAIFEMFWEFIILTEIAINYKKLLDKKPFLFDNDLLKEIDDLLTVNIEFEQDFDIRFNNMIEIFCESVLKSNPSEIRANILNNFYKDYYSPMKNLILKASRMNPIVILIDNLDNDWNSNNIESVSSVINSLFNVMLKINNNGLFGNCKVVTFLRTDIYKLSSRYDPDFDKRQPLFLTWSEEKLKELICERISKVKEFQEEKTKTKLWDSVFGKDLGTIKDTFNYIVKRTLLRPRDILKFCSIVIDQINKKDNKKMTEQIIYDSEKFYSSYLLTNLKREYSIGYPDVEEICIALFVNKSNTIYEEELKHRIGEYPNLLRDYSIKDLIKFCFEAGVLGLQYKENTCFSYQGYDYDRIRSKAQAIGDIIFTIHPGLNKELDLKVISGVGPR